jgi:lambda family phage tail tape measure protein
VADVTSLVLAVDSRQARTAAADLDRLTASGRRVEGAADTIRRSFRGLGAALGVVSAGAIVRAVVEQADAYSRLNARLRLVTASAGEFTRAQASIFEIAQRTRTGLGETAGLFGSLARSTEGLGKSQSEVLGVTETINQALQVSGTNAQSAAAALVQLGQGFASGTLRGEELNSVLEQAPRLAKAIADGLGVPIGKLRELGQQGKLTSQEVFNALQRSAGAIESEFRRLPLTVSSASTQAANALQKLIGVLDETSGATSSLANVISDAAGFIAELADEITKVSQGADSANILANAFVNATEALRVFGANVAFVFNGIGREIGAILAQITALATLDIAGFRAISDAVREDAQRARAELDAFEQRVLRRGPAFEALDTRAEDARLRRGIRPTPTSSDTGKKRDPFADEVKSLKERIALIGKNTELEKISVQIALGNFGKLSQARRQQLQDLAAEFDAKKAIFEISEAQPDLDIGRVKRQLDQLTGAYSAAETILEAQRQAGLVSEQEYTNARAGLIRLTADAQVRALEAENAALLKKNVTGLEQVRIAEQIADNEARIAIIRADSGAQIEALGIQQVAAARAAQKAIQDTEAALQSYLDSLVRAQQIELGGLGLGNRERDRRRQRAQLEDGFDQRRQDLLRSRRDSEFAGTFGPEQQKQYDRELAAINAFQAKALASFDTYYKELTEKQGDFTVGASEAINNYLDETQNALERSQQFFEGLFEKAEDLLADFIQTGKLDLKGFGDFIAQELSRATARNALAQGLEFLKGEAGKGGLLDGLGGLLGPFFGGQTVPGFAGGQIALGAGKTAAETAATAATTALTTATTASTAATTALTAAETAAATAIAAASASSAAALAALAASATAASAALATVGGSSLGGFFNDAGGLEVLGSLGFESGGYTGPGGKKQPAGVVHKGEVVWSQEDVKRAGGVSVVEALRKGLVQFDRGGVVGLDSPPIVYANGPTESNTTNNREINVGGLTINVQGPADRRNVEQMRVAVARGLSDVSRRRTAG